MKCLVTGAAGFIGYHLCGRLLARGEEVLGVDNLNAYYSPKLKHDRLEQLASQSAFEFRRVELSDRAEVGELFDTGDFDVVYHLAAQPGVRYSLKNPHAYVDSNLVAFVNVLEGCRHHGDPHLVYASSSSVYGGNRKVPFSVDDPVDNPVSLYAATKRANELTASTYAQLYSMAITGLRFFTVYGPWGRPDMAIYKFVDAMVRGEPIDVYNHGHMRRDFTYVEDIVDGVVRAADASLDRVGAPGGPAGHRLYNLGNNKPSPLGELIDLLEVSLGTKAERRLLPMQPGDVLETYADIDLTTRELGFQPTTSLEEGVRSFVAWYRSYHEVTAPAQPA
jgi:UDP-glucuronate 4-epimerase